MLPAGLTIGSVTPSTGTWSAPTWTIGTLADGASATLTIQATVNAGTAGSTITNTATNVTLDQVDSNATADDPSESITVGNSTDLVIGKTVDNGTPNEGDTVTFTVTVTNNGPAQASNVSIDDALPAGLTAGTITPSQGSWTAPTWTVGTIDAGSNAMLTIQASVDAGTAGSTITNTVTNVTLDQTDSDTTPDDLSESVTVGNATDLVIGKTVDNGTPDEGDTVTFTVTVTNNGPAQASNVSIDDALPAGLTIGSVTPSTGTWTDPTWTIGTLNSGASATLTIVADVDAGTAGSTITNTVSNVSLDQTDSNTTADDPSESITVGNATDLVIGKTVDNGTPDEGDTVTFTVTVTNSGPAQATNVSIDDAIPAGLTAGTITPSQGSYTVPTWTIGTIDSGANATLTIQATVDAGTAGSIITNTVTSVTLDQVDDNTTADDLSESITVGNATDLVIGKTVDNGTPDEGDTVTFTVTVTNNGPAQASNVSIDDALPAGLTIGSVTPSTGTWTDPTWTIGTLNSGASATLTIVADVDAGTAGSTITNTVSNVSLDQTDSNTTADDPSESITVGNATDLVIGKTVDNGTPDESDTVTFTVTVTNSGPAQATNLSIDDVVPAGLTAGTITPSQGSYTAPTWTIGTIDSGTNATLTIQASVDAGTSGQTITNTVTNVTLDQVDNNTTADDLSESITIGNSTDLAITKIVDNGIPDEGDTVTFTVTVTNNGPAQATNVSINDVVPAGLTAGTITPSQGSYTAPTWTVGTLANGSSATLTIQATVNTGAAGQTITNTVTNVTLDQTDSNTTADDPSESITVGNSTDLVIGKTVDNGTPNEGDTVTFTVTMTNSGPAQATNVSIDDVLPAGLTIGSATPNTGTWADPTWTIGTLNSGASATLTIVADVDAGTSGSTITNTVTNVTLDQTDSNATADDPSESITVGNSTDLVIGKTVDNGTPDEGDTVTFTVTVTNSGPAQATNVSIDDVLPAGLTIGSVTPSTGTWAHPTWTVGTLNSGASATLTIVADIDAGTSGSTITNTVTNVTLDQVDSNTTADDPIESITVGNTTDLAITKIVDNGTPDEGDTVTFTVTVTNNGPAQATNVSVDDALPAGLTIGSVTPSTGTWTDPTWTIGTLNNGASATLTIVADVDAGTSGSSITNTVTNVTLDQTDSNTTADDPSESVTVGNSTDLVIGKTVDNGTPNEGDTVTFTVTVTNSGPAQATNVSIDDVLPAGLTIGSATPNTGTWADPTWTIGTLNSGASATLTIVADVDAGTSGSTITNTVTNVALDQTDSNTTADDPSESITVGNSTDLVIGKTVDNGTPDEGDTVTFTVTVTNSGPAQATNVSIDDVLPAGLTIGSVTPSTGTWANPTWTMGTLNSGVSATLTIVADVDAGTSGSTITNTVTNVTLDQTDSNATADDPSEPITVGNATDLVISKTVDNGTPNEGDTVTFTVTVTNNGPAQATNLSIDDALPAGLTIGSATPSIGSYTAPTWTIGTLNSGASATLTIVADVDAGTAGSTITNTVTNVTLDQVDDNTTADDLSESITVGNVTDLVIGKTVDNGTPDEGDTVTFTVTVTNNGPAQATNVSIDDALPAGLTAGTITPSQGSFTAPTWTIGTLADGASATLTIQATVDAGTAGSTITNTVTNVVLDQVDSDTTADDLSESVTIGNSTDLVIGKTVDNTTPDEGDTVTFTVTVTNSGPAQASNVSIDDVVPAGLTIGSITPSIGSYTAPTWTVGTLNNGASATLTIVADVDAGTSGNTITNTVTNVTLDQTDSNTTADDLSESVTVSNATDLVIGKTVDNGTPNEGDTVTFTVTVTNSGPAQATNVSIDDALPAGLTAGTITPSQGSYTAPTWTIGTIDSGSNATLTIQATVNAGTAGSTITNTVNNVTLDQVDDNTTADDLSESVTVGNSTDLVIGKTVDNGTPDEGDTVTFTVTVTNSGPAQATNVSIDDALPAGLTIGSATPSIGSYTAPTWTIGTLNSGAGATLTIVADVDAGTSGSTITNTVTSVTLDQTDSNTTLDDPSESVTVGNSTDLVIGKTVDNGTPDEGDTVTFTVTVTNNGPAQASNVSIDDALPAGLTAGTITPSQGSFTAPTWTSRHPG